MNMNATLILQSIAMMVFVWFCMKVIWPPILEALDERRAKIADGLAASDRAEKALVEANREVEEQIKAARDKAGEIVEQAISVMAKSLNRPKTMQLTNANGRLLPVKPRSRNLPTRHVRNYVQLLPAWRYWAHAKFLKRKLTKTPTANCSTS